MAWINEMLAGAQDEALEKVEATVASNAAGSVIAKVGLVFAEFDETNKQDPTHEGSASRPLVSMVTAFSEMMVSSLHLRASIIRAATVEMKLTHVPAETRTLLLTFLVNSGAAESGAFPADWNDIKSAYKAVELSKATKRMISFARYAIVTAADSAIVVATTGHYGIALMAAKFAGLPSLAEMSFFWLDAVFIANAKMHMAFSNKAKALETAMEGLIAKHTALCGLDAASPVQYAESVVDADEFGPMYWEKPAVTAKEEPEREAIYGSFSDSLDKSRPSLSAASEEFIDCDVLKEIIAQTSALKISLKSVATAAVLRVKNYALALGEKGKTKAKAVTSAAASAINFAVSRLKEVIAFAKPTDAKRAMCAHRLTEEKPLGDLVSKTLSGAPMTTRPRLGSLLPLPEPRQRARAGTLQPLIREVLQELHVEDECDVAAVA